MFRPVSFAPSAAVSDLANGLGLVLEDLQKGFADGADALGELGLPEPQLPDMSDLVALVRKGASEAVATPVKFLAITPFQHGIGSRKGEHAFLTAQSALKVLIDRIASAGAAEEGELGIVILLIATQSHAALGQALDAFAKVYPIPQMQQISRRAKALATLDTDKFVVPAAPGFPPWSETFPQKNPKGQAVAKALGGMLAASEGATMAARDPAGMLTSFAKKQAAKVTEKAADLASLAASMSGGFDAWSGFAVHAPGTALFRCLSRLPLPFDESCKCSSLLCWLGKPGEIAFYRESFGLCRRTLTEPQCLVCPGENPECPF